MSGRPPKSGGLNSVVSEFAISLVYGAAELATLRRGVRRRINGGHIRFPARWSRYYPSQYQEMTDRFLHAHCRPGSSSLDIGAHFGLFSVAMARAVGPGGRVFSFEPTPLSRKVLARTVRLNGCGTIVEVRPEAVAASTGTATFHAVAPTSNANSLVSPSSDAQTVSIASVSVDDFVRDRGLTVSCLKIDAEGGELDVIAGAIRTIAGQRPAIALDVHPALLRRSGRSTEELWDRVRDLDLRVARGGCTIDKRRFCTSEVTFDVELLARSQAAEQRGESGVVR